MHPRLSVNAMCSFAWPFERDLALWSSLGVRHAGLLISKLGGDPDRCIQQLTAAGISVSTLITESFELREPETWERTRAQHRLAIDLVASCGGHSIYFTAGRTTCVSWQEDLDRFAEAVAPTLRYGRERGVAVGFEPTGRTSVSFVTTLRDAIDVAERTGIGVVADFGTIWSERDLSQTLRRAMPHVVLLQICDTVIGAAGRPAPGGRAHLGEGELPLLRMMKDVLDAGYNGVFDLEVVGADVAASCDEQQLRKGIENASALLYAIEI